MNCSRKYNIANSECNCTLPPSITEWNLVERDGGLFRDIPVKYFVKLYKDKIITVDTGSKTMAKAIELAIEYAQNNFNVNLDKKNFKYHGYSMVGPNFIAEVEETENEDYVFLEVGTIRVDCPIHDD